MINNGGDKLRFNILKALVTESQSFKNQLYFET